jgi:CubicO group peptidase (beta-lactamase class C family)
MDMKIVTPESVGMSASHLDEIDTAMQAFVDQNNIVGITTLISRYGKVAHHGCYGKLDLALNKPIQTDSLFRIQSLTKPITAVAALILYDEGHFNLNPEFKNFKVMKDSTDINSELVDLEKEITFRHLLTHTSGLAYGMSASADPIGEIYRDAKMINSIAVLLLPLQEIIQKVAELPLASQPGATWRYSLAYDILGYLIGLISGKP